MEINLDEDDLSVDGLETLMSHTGNRRRSTGPIAVAPSSPISVRAKPKRSRLSTSPTDSNSNTLSAEIALLRSTNQAVQQENQRLHVSLSEARQKLRQSQLLADRYETDLDSADIRIRDLEVMVFDLQDSNSKYALNQQDLLTRAIRSEAARQDACQELITSMQVHTREMSLLMDHYDKERTRHIAQLGQVNTPSCLLCCESEEETEFTVLEPCRHVVCSNCRLRINTCPFCRKEINQDSADVTFKRWW
jgi:septal ring factor EnvC (AmiA/AmiB activator)